MRRIRPRPVIVVHLDTAPGAGRTACTGEDFDHDDGIGYKDTPRVMCVACARAAVTGYSYHVPDGAVITISNGQTVITRPQMQT